MVVRGMYVLLWDECTLSEGCVKMGVVWVMCM